MNFKKTHTISGSDPRKTAIYTIFEVIKMG